MIEIIINIISGILCVIFIYAMYRPALVRFVLKRQQLALDRRATTILDKIKKGEVQYDDVLKDAGYEGLIDLSTRQQTEYVLSACSVATCSVYVGGKKYYVLSNLQ